MNLDRFRLLLLAGALEINIKLHENKQVISFPPCPCVPSAKQTLEIVRSEGCYNLLVPVSFLAGEFLIGFFINRSSISLANCVHDLIHVCNEMVLLYFMSHQIFVLSKGRHMYVSLSFSAFFCIWNAMFWLTFDNFLPLNEGCNTPNPTPQVIEKLRLPGMDNVWEINILFLFVLFPLIYFFFLVFFFLF